MHPEAIKIILKETNDKLHLGQARILKWGELKKKLPPTLKISPLAASPHKSHSNRLILNLSYSQRVSTGQYVPSINESTNTSTALLASMKELGWVLPQIIYTLAVAWQDRQ